MSSSEQYELALEQMRQQIEFLRGCLPANMSDENDAGKTSCSPSTQKTVPETNNKGFTKIVAAKQNPDGTFTKMFALKREVATPEEPETKFSQSETLERLRSQVENRIGRPLPRPNSIEEEQEIMQDEKSPSNRKFDLFFSVADAEQFLMFTINQIVTMFNKIAKTLKNDTLNCWKSFPNDEPLKRLIIKQCLDLLLDIECAMNESINKLKDDWSERFRALIPELDCTFNQIMTFQEIEIENIKNIAKHEANIEVHMENSVLTPKKKPELNCPEEAEADAPCSRQRNSNDSTNQDSQPEQEDQQATEDA